jgi:O-antigen ligase
VWVNLKRTMIHNWQLCFEVTYAATVLFALTVGPIYTLWRNAQLNNSAIPIDSAHLASFVILQLPALFLLGRRFTIRLTYKSPEMYVLLLVGWLIAASVFSDTGAYAIRNAVNVALCVSTGLYIAVTFTRRQQLLVIAIAAQVGVVISRFAISRGWPESTFGTDEWSGIYVNPNLLGPVAAIGIVTVLLLAISSTKQLNKQWQWVAIIATADIVLFDLSVLVRTRAFTSVLSVVLAAILISAVFAGSRMTNPENHQRLWTAFVLGSTALVVAVIVFLYVFGSSVSGRLFPKSVLQERIFAWEHSWTGFIERPWLGWGQGVAWSNPTFRRLDLYWTVENIGHSHSAYLDVLLSGGVVAGLLAGTYILFAMFRMAVAERPGFENLCQLTIAMFCLVAAIFEPFIFSNYFLWPILIMVLTPQKEIIGQ